LSQKMQASSSLFFLNFSPTQVNNTINKNWYPPCIIYSCTFCSNVSSQLGSQYCFCEACKYCSLFPWFCLVHLH
jgi:hypothetical protein